VRLIVLHTAEGARTYQSLGSFFASSSSGVSSHVGIDDTPNTVGEYVKRPDKAWTQANYNPMAVAAELCAFAAWDSAEWSRHPNMLATTAAWIQEEAAAFNIPIVRLTPNQAQGGGRGVCQHVDLGAGGGGHTDCGKAFPMDQVLDMAMGWTPSPTPEQEEETLMVMIMAPTGAIAMFDGAKKVPVASTNDVRAFQSAGIKQVSVSQAQWDAIPNP